MYLEYWGLGERPFENTPNPRFLYPSKQHQEGLRKLLYAISEGKGCAVLTGEYGCGKTHLIRTIAADLEPRKFEIALINYPIFRGQEFVEEVLHQFGRDAGAISPLKGFRELSRFLYRGAAASRQNVLIIDEAQIIEDREIYEQLRLLLNIQLEDRFLVNLVLVGQPELREHLKHYPQLEQRIALKFHLDHFDQEDSTNYVLYRLEVAGASRPIFSQEALYLIYRISDGVPRRINTVADMCLFEGAGRKADTIDESIIKDVL